MTSQSPITACLIVRDCEESLRECLDSVREHVDEIAIVDTGSEDSTPDIAKSYADKFATYTDCNDQQGRILDFSMARNRSLELASHDWIIWIDSDDVLHGGERLVQLVDRDSRIRLGTRSLTDEPRATRYLMRYQYSPTIDQWRERLCGPKAALTWQGPVHEGLFPRPGIVQEDHLVDAIWLEHRAHIYPQKKREVGRNLRILEAYCARAGDGDPRMMCYLGTELAGAGRIGEAITKLRRASQIETWPDQRTMALLQLAEIYAELQDHESAVHWATQAMLTKSWSAPFYRMAWSFYSMALQGANPEYNFRRCIRFARLGIQAKEIRVPVLLLENTEDHSKIYQCLTASLYATGFIDEAIDACQTGLGLNPQDPNLLENCDIMTRRRRDAARPPGPPPITQPKACDLDAGKLDVVIFTGQAMEHWDPETIARSGIGGSETMAWELSRRLSRRGHRVRLYGDPPDAGVHEGVEFLPWQSFPEGVQCDVLITSRRPDAVDVEVGCRARVRILWIHDVYAPGLDLYRLMRLDEIWCLSEWHRGFVQEMLLPGIRDKVIAIRNGIDVEKIEALATEAGPRVPHRAIYCSSPDRGLETALDCWPKVRESVPDAELHVFYGFQYLDRTDPQNSRQLREKMQRTPGVTYHGRVPETELLRWMLTSGVWAYPTWQWAGPGAGETSCISAMQAQACGLVPVTSPIAALKETVFSGVRIEGDWRSAEYQEKWIGAVVDSMHDVMCRNNFMTEARIRFCIETLVDELEERLVWLYETKAANVTPVFREVEVA